MDTWITIENLNINEGSQLQKATYFILPFTKARMKDISSIRKYS